MLDKKTFPGRAKRSTERKTFNSKVPFVIYIFSPGSGSEGMRPRTVTAQNSYNDEKGFQAGSDTSKWPSAILRRHGSEVDLLDAANGWRRDISRTVTETPSLGRAEIKVEAEAEAQERVGVLARQDGTTQGIEYRRGASKLTMTRDRGGRAPRECWSDIRKDDDGVARRGARGVLVRRGGETGARVHTSVSVCIESLRHVSAASRPLLKGGEHLENRRESCGYKDTVVCRELKSRPESEVEIGLKPEDEGTGGEQAEDEGGDEDDEIELGARMGKKCCRRHEGQGGGRRGGERGCDESVRRSTTTYEEAETTYEDPRQPVGVVNGEAAAERKGEAERRQRLSGHQQITR
ncbi:hypothetical protein C8R45DRAFT_1076699 [Mycena sanguinolenta]|nr:hypothetical protein C8R45DRAFT_1076699 [Mycena sanguinolenta]